MCYIFIETRPALIESVSQAILFLNQNSEVSTKVENYWKLSHSARRYIILDLSITTADYLQQFPSLTQPNGHKLVSVYNCLFLP